MQFKRIFTFVLLGGCAWQLYIKRKYDDDDDDDDDYDNLPVSIRTWNISLPTFKTFKSSLKTHLLSYY